MKKTWLGIFFSVLIWSGINPKDYPTWALETAPAMIGFIVLVATRQRFRLTGLTYNLILIHSIILMIGGHYTYAEVPLFDWLKEVYNFERNNYDKARSFCAGFCPGNNWQRNHHQKSCCEKYQLDEFLHHLYLPGNQRLVRTY